MPAGAIRLMYVVHVNKRSRTLRSELTNIRAINRTNSWSRMKITLQMFNAICGYFRFNPFLIPLVASMGFKLEPNDEHFVKFQNNISTCLNDQKVPIEVDFGQFMI